MAGHGGGPGAEELHAAVTALRRRWGPAVDGEVVAELGGSDRSTLWRIAISGADAPARTAVVKRYGDASSNWRNEAAAAAYLGRAGGGLTPDLLALDRERGLVVLTDLGDHPQLSDVLLGADRDAAERALLDWGHDLGSLLARTFGGRAEFEQTWAELGLGGAPPSWNDRIRTACAEVADLAGSRLGTAAPPGLRQDLDRAVASLDDTAWEVVTPGDMCPDNNLLTPSGVRFLDLEFAGCSPLFLQAAYARLPFPTCWCLLATPPGLLPRVEAALRRPLVAVRPELADDATWRAGMATGCLLWTVLRLAGLLARLPDEANLGTWDRDGVPMPAWDRGTAHYLARAGQTLGTELPAAAELLAAVHGRLTERFGALDVAPYPAFRTSDGPA